MSTPQTCDHPPRLWRKLADGPVILCASCCCALGEECRMCDGMGIPSSSGIKCSVCGGIGWVRYADMDPDDGYPE